ncbi:MAG: AcrR family transcriptional regulator [Myxococcota bacterium]|jgi:AcrR family transcriptional regulator
MASLDQQMRLRREAILEAARNLIETRGYGGLTMRNLAVESAVTVPTIYNLIGNKEAVLFAAVKEQTRNFVSNLERAESDLITVVEATVRQLLRRPSYYRALLLVLANTDDADDARRHVGGVIARQIKSSLQVIASEGELADWVDVGTLSQRLHAHIDMASIEWARGSLTASSFRAAALFDVGTTMLGVTTGASRETFEGIIREHQANAIQRRPRIREGGQAA